MKTIPTFNKISIIGVGLIGGSIGLAAKERRLAKEIIGIGRRTVSIKKAISRRAIDKGTLSIKDGLRDADLIIIATPVDKVKAKIKEAFRYAKSGAIVIDVNSTKEEMVDFADRITPKGISFVGTHPLAGSEHSGVIFAEKNLFKDTICIVTPTKKTDKAALLKIIRFWKALGATVKQFSPSKHDKVVARISHLPHILSYSLCNIVLLKDMQVSGNGFKDTTRIAKSIPSMWADIFLQNRRSILDAIEDFQKAISLVKSDIKNKKRNALLIRLNGAKQKRDKIG